jgi:hypothetical protein
VVFQTANGSLDPTVTFTIDQSGGAQDSLVNGTITVASGVLAGGRTLYVTTPAAGNSNAIGFGIQGDLTPQIDSVGMLAPLLSGQTASATISGSNFGPACAGSSLPCQGAGVGACVTGATTCAPTGAPTDVTVTIISWSDTQIQVGLAAGPSASGYYDVQVTSAGASGTPGMSYMPMPSQPTTGASNRGRFTVNGNSGVVLSLSSQTYPYQSGAQPLSAGGCAYIDPTSNMPQIVAQIQNSDPNNQTPISGNATYQLTTSFGYLTHPSPQDSTVTSANDPPVVKPSSPAQVAASQAWTVPFGSDVFGGAARLDWTYNGTPQQSVNFKICGQNPSFSTATAATQQLSYWFAWKMAIHETNMSPFCETGRQQVPNYCSQSKNIGFPTFGPPAGYGMIHTDPIVYGSNHSDPVSAQEPLWNWNTGLQAWQQSVTTYLAGPAVDDTQNPNDQLAFAFWLRQVRQWNDYNSRHPNAKAAAPADDVYSNASSPDPNAPALGGGHAAYQCTFTMPVQNGSGLLAPTSSADQANGRFWFGDAVLVKQLGGAPHQYISFLTDSGTWKRNFPNCISKNLVYEMCTCTSPGYLPTGQDCNYLVQPKRQCQ